MLWLTIGAFAGGSVVGGFLIGLLAHKWPNWFNRYAIVLDKELTDLGHKVFTKEFAQAVLAAAAIAYQASL